MLPTVTVGLTTYNAAATVERAVQSALSQTVRPLEVIVVDDASTDGTIDLLELLAAQHPEMRVLQNDENAGVAVSRNKIIAEAKGEFLAFFDDDDVSHPDRIGEQLRRITNYEDQLGRPAKVVCHTARRVIYPDGAERIEPTMGQSIQDDAPCGRPVADRILLGTPLRDGYGACATCSQMARVETYQSIEGFDPRFRRSEDTDFIIRLAIAGGHFVGVAEPLVIQYMTKTSEKSLAIELNNMLSLLEKHRSIMDESNQYEFCREWMTLKYDWLQRRHVPVAARLLRLICLHPTRVVRRLVSSLHALKTNRAFRSFYRSGVSCEG